MRRPWTARRHGLAGVALASALLLPATPAAAGTVTTLADSGAGSLRAAIDGAAPGETIDFAAGLEGTIELVSTLEIDTSLRIDGPGARRLAVSGMDAVRVFHVRGAGTEAEIRELTIRDGRVPGTYPMGAGLLADESASSVRLVRAAVLDNEAASTTDLPLGGGLGVVAGTLELVDSTVAGNRASGGGGGGVMIGEPAGFVIRASTIVGNSASAGGGVVSVGSAGTITDSTIAGNTATTSGGGLLSSAFGSITVGRSLLSGNGCGGPIVSAGDNVSDAACFAAPLASDTVDAAAQVGALADHGGATDTVLPVPASPAVDHVGGACAAADQRGVARPQGAGCDAGAVEVRAARLTASGPLALGTVLVGAQGNPESTTVTNAGDRDAVITAIGITGPAAAEVEAVPAGACAVSQALAPGASCTLTARLAPTSGGPKDATYAVSLAASGVDVPITGTGARAAQLEASGALALGTAQVGKQTPAATVEITNTGDLDADITAVTLTGPAAAEVEPVADPDACTDATVLASGEHCVLSARLAPLSAGAKQATYTVSLTGSSVAVAVTGTGEAAPPPPAGQNDGGGSSSGPPSGDPPPSPPSSATAVVVGTGAKAAKRGKVKLRLRCQAVGLARCAGTLTLKIGARKLTRAYSIAAGTDALITLKLGARERRRLAKRRSLASTVRVITAQGDGSRRTTHSGAFKLRS